MVSIRQALIYPLVACVMSVALVAAGCGGDDDSSSQTTETSVEASAEGLTASVQR